MPFGSVTNVTSETLILNFLFLGVGIIVLLALYLLFRASRRVRSFNWEVFWTKYDFVLFFRGIFDDFDLEEVEIGIMKEFKHYNPIQKSFTSKKKTKNFNETIILLQKVFLYSVFYQNSLKTLWKSLFKEIFF